MDCLWGFFLQIDSFIRNCLRCHSSGEVGVLLPGLMRVLEGRSCISDGHLNQVLAFKGSSAEAEKFATEQRAC